MPYNVNLSNGDLLAIVEDGTAEISKSSIAMIGKNFPGYGEYINENFVHIVENFASEEAPANQLTGQLWYQINTGELKLWNSQEWVSAGKPTITNDTVSPAAQFVTFVGSSTGSPDFKVSASRGITFVPSTGNFGVGVNEAGSRMVVSKNSLSVAPAPQFADNVVHIHGNNGEGASLTIDSYSGTGGTYDVNHSPELILRRSNGTASALEAVKNNDVVGSIKAQGYHGLGFSSSGTETRASINFVATENWSTGSCGTKLVLRTTKNGSAIPATALTVENNGDVLLSSGLNVTGQLDVSGEATFLDDLSVSGEATFLDDLTVGGTIRAGGDVTAYYTSDQRLKFDMQPIDNALDKVSKLDGITFSWNADAKDKFGGPREPGLLAQQVQQVLPEAVIKRNDGYLALRYEQMVPLLVEAIKELKTEIENLKSK